MADELVQFIWQGIDRSGRKLLRQQITARNELIARAELKKQGYYVKAIRPRRDFSRLFSKQHTIKPQEVTLFARQLSTLIDAGVPLAQAIDIIAKGQSNLGMQSLLISIKTDVAYGDSLSAVLRKHPKYFDDLFCNLIALGEHAGALDTLLDKVANYKEKTELIKRKIKKALAYPVAIIVVAIVVTTILLIYVVPVFAELFKNFGAELPLFTQVVVNLSTWLKRDILWILILLAGLIYSFYTVKKRSARFNHQLDKQLLKLPIVGHILEKSAIARFARTLSTMSTAGLPLVDALQSVSGVCGNTVFRDAILQMRDDIAKGERLQLTINQSTVFPVMVQQMIAIGEESGHLDDMLARIADFYEDEVDHLVDNLGRLIEPIIMAVLGVIVGGLVVAMYLPIFQMGSVVS